MKTCPKCGEAFTICPTCSKATHCAKCGACFGYQGMLKPPPMRVVKDRPKAIAA